MVVELLHSNVRWVLVAVTVICGGLAMILPWWQRRRRRAWLADMPAGQPPGAAPPQRSNLVRILAPTAAVLAATALAVVVIEQAITLVVSSSAPTSSDFNEFRWVTLSPWGWPGTILGVLTGVVIIALSWRASRRVFSPWRRTALVGLRAGAVCVALIMFLEPAIELRQVARDPNRVAVVVDASRSMELREDPDGPSRTERVRRFLERSAETLDGWQGEHEIDVFEFGESLLPSSRRTVATEKPTGQATLMRLALEQVRARYDGASLAGVILLSDGVATGGFGDEEGATIDFLQSLDTRVHTVWAGRDGLKDIAVARILADEFAFVRTVVRIETVIRATGYDKRRIPVTLRSDGRDLHQKWVEVGGDTRESKVSFEISPPRVGKYVYEIATPVADDEAVSSNNRRAVVLRVIRDKIRVLQVAGRPSWDVRALRRMLKQNPNVDLISFFILRTLDDFSTVPNSEMSLIPFPTRELFEQELPSFDLIVLQNFEFAPYGIGIYLDNIEQYVRGGGGLVMLGGAQSFHSGGYAGTPVADALPVELGNPYRLQRETRDSRGPINTDTFRPILTGRGKRHPITALRYELSDNLATWKSLPELEGINLVAGAKPDATVLAVHPRLRTADGDRMPLLVVGEHGDGRTLAATTDSLWRWGFIAAAKAGDDGRHYAKLWENAIRWLISDPELRYLHVSSDAVEYPPETPIRLDVRLLDRDYTPLDGGEVTLEVVRGADPRQVTQVARKTLRVGASGEGAFEISGLEPGVYRVRGRAMVAGRPTTASDIFLVREAATEFDEPAADETLLRRVAAASNGLYLGSASALPGDLPLEEPRVIRVDRRADVELWNRPSLLFLAFLLLGLEWVLRQRSGYL